MRRYREDEPADVSEPLALPELMAAFVIVAGVVVLVVAVLAWVAITIASWF